MLLCLEWGRAQTVGRERRWTKPVVRLPARVHPLLLVARVRRERTRFGQTQCGGGCGRGLNLGAGRA